MRERERPAEGERSDSAFLIASEPKVLHPTADPSTHLAASSSKMDAGALMRLFKNDTHPIGTPVIVTFTQP